MCYQNLRTTILDLEKHGHLVRIREEVDPNLEMAAIHRAVFQAQGPAIFFERVKGSPFPAVSNLFGTVERAKFIFRRTWQPVCDLVRAKGDPLDILRRPFHYWRTPLTALTALPRRVYGGAVFHDTTSLDQLPQIKCWPDDGGPFILLPQVYTEDPEKPGPWNSNLGMYRIQLSGNEYAFGKEIGLHYQIRRDIGIHHTKAQTRGEPLRVSVFVGGPLAHSFAAVMYLPEGLLELHLAGALTGRAFRYAKKDGFTISADADFCITGWIDPQATKPEGPFGDHLGYYSLKHPFPFMRVEKIYHRKDAVWPFTVVGRPPQEDSVFGQLVQEMAGPVISREIPGIKEVHAVDASGVHPLLLAIGHERYAPYQEREPREILKGANALLGYGPCALAKYVLIAAHEDDPKLSTRDILGFFRHLLERVDFRRDLHFQTRTTMDTLDYTGGALNAGSKVVIAAAGKKIRDLMPAFPSDIRLPEGYERPRMVMPGIAAVRAPKFSSYDEEQVRMDLLAKFLEPQRAFHQLPLILLVDDSEFVSSSFQNFLWVTFTRSNPSHDLYGVGSFQKFKHWGCDGPLLIDARIKPHHAPVLEEDPKILERIKALAGPSGPLHGII